METTARISTEVAVGEVANSSGYSSSYQSSISGVCSNSNCHSSIISRTNNNIMHLGYFVGGSGGGYSRTFLRPVWSQANIKPCNMIFLCVAS